MMVRSTKVLISTSFTSFRGLEQVLRDMAVNLDLFTSSLLFAPLPSQTSRILRSLFRI
jgi:hypothetical protein